MIVVSIQVPFLQQRYCDPVCPAEVQLIDLSHFEPKEDKEQKHAFICAMPPLYSIRPLSTACVEQWHERADSKLQPAERSSPGSESAIDTSPREQGFPRFTKPRDPSPDFFSTE
jgi:hypothetical protein